MYKQKNKLFDAFGKTQEEDILFVDFPTKISGVTLSRLLYGEFLGCSYCFPHGPEVTNNRHSKTQRSWKKHRKTQYHRVS